MQTHGLRKPNEGLNETNLKILRRTWQTNQFWSLPKFGIFGISFGSTLFSGASIVRVQTYALTTLLTQQASQSLVSHAK